MKKHIGIKKVYLFTFISFIATFLFLSIFAETAPGWYTGWDMHTNTNTISTIADVVFFALLLLNFIGVLMSITYTCRSIFRKFSKNN